MISFLLFSLLLAQPICENALVESSAWPPLKQNIDQRLAEASSLVNIASEADGILAKLIAAKSPVLLSWLDKRELMAASEEKIAGEWRKYYLHQFILSRFPTDNPKVNSSVEGLFSDINKMAFDKKEKERINRLFDKARTDAKQLMSGWNLPAQAKTQATHRIDTMKLYWYEKLEGTRYASKALEFVGWGFAYDPVYNEINVGVQARKYPTDANLYAVLLHEMGHSIDPCRWSFYVKSQNPFDPVLNCLRDKKSVMALKRDDSKMKASIKNNVLTEEMAQSLKENPTCNRTFYPPEGTQKDQILESFADWFSAEVFASSTFAKENPRPDLCGDQKLMAGSSYPVHQDRLLKIYLAHPTLSALQPKTAKAHHCELSALSPK